MYQLWILNTAFDEFQKVGPLIPHADALKWIVTLRQHFDVREMRLLPATEAATARSVPPGE